MRIVLTGGVTGGHIYPALAIGDSLRKADPDCKIIYIASGDRLERAIIPEKGYELYEVKSEPLDRSDIFSFVRTVRRTLAGRSEAIRIMKKFRPDAIVSTGSYVSVPVVLAGKACGASVFIQEQNGFPGVSNRFLSKFADAVFLGFESAGEYFRDKAKLIYSGNPVRRDFYGRSRTEDRKLLGIPAEDLVIMIFGGSLGAAATNMIGEAVARSFADMPGYTVIWGTGTMYHDEITGRLSAEGFRPKNLILTDYIRNMPAYLGAADISVSRSGALSTAETNAEGRAAIFIPSPNVTADHQYYNAKASADNGGAFIVRENENMVRDVMRIIDSLDKDREQIRRMEAASRELASADAADIICDSILATLRIKGIRE